MSTLRSNILCGEWYQRKKKDADALCDGRWMKQYLLPTCTVRYCVAQGIKGWACARYGPSPCPEICYTDKGKMMANAAKDCNKNVWCEGSESPYPCEDFESPCPCEVVKCLKEGIEGLECGCPKAGESKPSLEEIDASPSPEHISSM